jgi:hypothetical protein
MPLGFGLFTVLWAAPRYREPDPGPGNMPSFIPTAPLMYVGGFLICLWSLPLLALVVRVWLGREWAYIALGAIFLLQGVSGIGGIMQGRFPPAAWLYVLIHIAAGVALLWARSRVPKAALTTYGFPVVAPVESDPHGPDA